MLEKDGSLAEIEAGFMQGTIAKYTCIIVLMKIILQYLK